MATIRNGGNGAFSGKAGSFIGSSWNNVTYMKGIPKLSNKPASAKQLEQRLKFATVLDFLSPIKDVLNLGFKSQAGNKATGFNMSIQYALANSLIGAYPEFEIDLEKVVLAKGSLEDPLDAEIDASAAGKLKLTWLPNVNNATSYVDDNIRVLIYNKPRKLFMLIITPETRGDASLTMNIPNNFSTEEICVYMFYVNRNGLRCSNSVYVGQAVLA